MPTIVANEMLVQGMFRPDRTPIMTSIPITRSLQLNQVALATNYRILRMMK